jgi:hypothetical protein
MNIHKNASTTPRGRAHLMRALRRCERQSAGELPHLDTKKLGRFDKPGHRVTGDRTQNTPRCGTTSAWA